MSGQSSHPQRLPKECGRHTTQGSSPQPHTGGSSLLGLAPVAPFASPIYPEGIPAHSRWSSAAKTTGHRLPTPAYPEGIVALRVVDSRESAGIPSGYGSLLEREPVVFAALDHRLWAVTPAGWGVDRIPRIRRSMATALLPRSSEDFEGLAGQFPQAARPSGDGGQLTVVNPLVPESLSHSKRAWATPPLRLCEIAGSKPGPHHSASGAD